MKTITRLENSGETWQGKNGTMYKFNIEFSDGESGQCNSTKTTTPYSVGDEVEVSVIRDSADYGKTFSVKKPGQGGNYGGGKPAFDENGAMIGNAISNSIKLLELSSIAQETITDVEKLKAYLWNTSKLICNCSIALKEEYKK